MHLLKAIVVGSLFVSQAVLADTVTLKNGDVLTGTVVKKETDQLVFKTKYTGEINITWSEIATLNTDAPVKVVMADDSRFNATLEKKEAGRVKAVNPDLEMSSEVDLSQVNYINPSPALSGDGLYWTGNADLGGAITQGNTDNSLLRFSAETIGRSKKNRVTLGAFANRAKSNDESTAFNSKAYGQLDHFLNKQWYLYGNGSLEHDKFRDIKLRSNSMQVVVGH